VGLALFPATVAVAVAAALAAPALTAPALASSVSLPSPLPMSLPPGGGAHAARATSTPTWLVGARARPAAVRLARRAGARRIGADTFVVATGRARAAARALRAAGLLTFAEPDVRFHRASALDGHPEQWARAPVVLPTLAAPPVGTVSIGIADDLVDPTNPDVGPQTRYLNRDGSPPAGPHGTEVASVAAAAAGNGGVMGVLPGAPLVSYALPQQIACSDLVRGVNRLTAARVAVINISLTSPNLCVALYAAVERAIRAGIIVVAAAGNEFEQGNPVEYPAAFPHVLSVAALDTRLLPASFSNANAAVDLSAPGEQVPVAVPLAFDTSDGAADGITRADGTSFAAPMVAGAAAWVRTVRPRLTGLQVADVLRDGARNLGRRGWDPDTGWGLVNVARAVTAHRPAIDPLEPNEDIPFVNGTFSGHADRAIYAGHGTRSVRATVDYAEDPTDVYRIRLLPRSAARVVLRPAYGDPDLAAYDGRARSLGAHRRLLGRSARSRGADRLVLANRDRRTRTAYVVVNASRTRGRINARYRLTITRARLSPTRTARRFSRASRR